MKLSTHQINLKRDELTNHPFLTGNNIKNREDLSEFMECHIYAVWDFMSLAKSLQHFICPSSTLWMPTKLQRAGSRFINEIILAEESDKDSSGNTMSHFDLYLQAMVDVGANPEFVLQFLKEVNTHGIDYALDNADIPRPCAHFMRHTFNIIATNKPHVIAASFCFGRETVIPDMFTKLISQLKITNTESPRFHYYLERHIEVDSGEHGPAALEIINVLCDNDPVKIVEAEKAALASIQARYNFWTAIQHHLKMHGKNIADIEGL